MIIDIYCCGCKEFILQADTDTLKTPLVGNMFKVRPGREWSMFSPHDIGYDLTCPLCEWSFHQDGHVSAVVGTDSVSGLPEMIIPGILATEGKTLVEVFNAEEEVMDEQIETATDMVTERQPEEHEKNKQATEALLNAVVESVQDTPMPEPIKDEKPTLNEGVWSKTADGDENSEMEGKAPQGTVAVEPITKRLSRKAKKAVQRLSVG